MSSVVNFDRDLQFVAPADTDRTFSDMPVDGPFTVPVKLSPDQTFGTLKTEPVVRPVAGSTCAVRGLSFVARLERQVIRVRGTIYGPAECAVALMAGWTDTYAGENQEQTPIKMAHHWLNFDETICLEGVTVDLVDPNYHVIYLAVYNFGTDPAEGAIGMQMSWQDISVAPPEYEAARR